MAFEINSFDNVSSGAGNSPRLWAYRNLNDTLATIGASDYFYSARFRLDKDDLIFIVGSDGADQILITSDNGTSPVTNTTFIPASGGAPQNATYITQTPNGSLSNEQPLSLLATGLLKSTTITGVVSIGVNGTDFYGPGAVISPADGGTGINNGAKTITIGGNTAFTGAFTFSGALTANTSVTFPTSGTLSTTTGTVTSVSGTANRITSTGGTDPVIDISASYVGQSSLTTLGTISTGVWGSSATKIGLTSGGTNTSLTAAAGGIVYSTSTGMGISAVGAASQILLSGATGAPTWTTSTYPATNAINTLLYASSANVMSALATANSGVLVTSAGGVPSISGTLPFTVPVTTGGTGLTSTTANQILYSTSNNVIGGLTSVIRSVLTNTSAGIPSFIGLSSGQIIIGSTAGSPAAAFLSAGTGITITNAANSITIASSSGENAWINQASTPITMVVNTPYTAETAGVLTFNVPATVAKNSTFEIVGVGAGGWLLQMNTGQVCNFNSTPTSSGGSLSSTNRYNTIKILCTTANTTFVVMSNEGTLTVA